MTAPVRPISALLLWSLLLLAGCASDSVKREYDGQTISEAKRATPAANYSELGLRYMQKGHYKRALHRLHKAISLDPELPSSYLYLGQLYNELDEFSAAETNYRKAMALDPGYSRAHNNLGVFLCERGRYAEAETEFKLVLSDPLYEHKAATLENMGLCALGAGQPAKAESYFKAAINASPIQARSLLNLAQINFDRDDARTAQLYLDHYRKVAAPTPESLWLGINVERSLGNNDAEASLSLLLAGHFPRSAQAHRLQQESP